MAGCGLVLRNDALAVAAAVLVDMGYGFIDGSDGANAHLHTEPFGPPNVVIGDLIEQRFGIGAAESLKGFGIGMEADAFGCQRRNELREVGKTLAVDEKAVEGIADGGAARLGIVDNALSFGHIATLVEIAVDDTGTSLYHRHLGCIAHKRDKSFAATGNAQVDIADSGQQFARGLMGSGEEFHNGGVDAVPPKDLMDELNLSAIGAVGFLSAFQNGRIATLETEREHVESNVRTGLKNHSYNTKRHTHPTQMEAVVERSVLQHAAERRRQCGDMAHVGGDSVEAVGSEEQTVVESIVLTGFFEVGSIGLEDSILTGNDGIGNGIEDVVTNGIGHKGKRFRRRLDPFECIC